MSNFSCVSSVATRRTLQTFKLGNVSCLRYQSSLASLPTSRKPEHHSVSSTNDAESATAPLSRLSTWSLFRNIILSHFLTRPIFFKPGLAFMRAVANSESRLLNPDQNPLLRAVLKPIVYDQFCAGTNDAEIRKTIADIKALGFSGVALCYAKEIQLDADNKSLGSHSNSTGEIEQWREGTLKTVGLVDAGNWIGIKYTGAGEEVTQALVRGDAPPPAFAQAMKDICDKAAAQNCRIWIDAEQQAVQPTIDKWTLDLMRVYNRGPKPVLYHTVQAYLKESRPKLQRQLELAEKEGFLLGVKLVRGAYIANDRRELIHDTKSDTDDSYNGIVRDVLSGKFAGLSQNTFSHLKLLLAGHNTESIRKACGLAKELSTRGELAVSPEFAQLQGMADDIGCEVVHLREKLEADSTFNKEQKIIFDPHSFKCLTWGSVQECMQYLVRRAVENAGAVDRMRGGAAQSAKELGRRFSLLFSGGS